MSKKGTGTIGIIFIFLVTFIILGIIGGILTSLWRGASASAGFSGAEAFFYQYPMFWIFIIAILGILAWVRFGSAN